MLTKHLTLISTLFGIIASIIGGWLFIETRYAHAEEVELQIKKIVVDSQQLLTDYRIEDNISQYQWIQSRKEAGKELTDFEKAQQTYLINNVQRLQSRAIDLQKKQLILDSNQQIVKDVLIETDSSSINGE
ncbi:MAG: hypothetical protein DRG78_12515 [Epsilonproteobacteria bacterium]|nr:MAG: hypothetical protein DRG78_12515 [Campylobacterota bacterium]